MSFINSRVCCAKVCFSYSLRTLSVFVYLVFLLLLWKWWNTLAIFSPLTQHKDKFISWLKGGQAYKLDVPQLYSRKINICRIVIRLKWHKIPWSRRQPANHSHSHYHQILWYATIRHGMLFTRVLDYYFVWNKIPMAIPSTMQISWWKSQLFEYAEHTAFENL